MLRNRRVEVVDYDPQWPATFADLKLVLEAKLGDLGRRIEHVGSTSVPGLAGKPVIDLDIVIESYDSLTEVAAHLAELGYTHVGDLGVPDREAFRRADEDVPRDGTGRKWPRHNLYVCPRDGAGLVQHLDFRDYLRAHPEEHPVYVALKRRLAEQFPEDIDSYAEAKSDYIREVLGRAAAWRKSQ
jgi:GrpB-like predicted nucleotidyltransferase (UPF0157 family)